MTASLRAVVAAATLCAVVALGSLWATAGSATTAPQHDRWTIPTTYTIPTPSVVIDRCGIGGPEDLCTTPTPTSSSWPRGSCRGTSARSSVPLVCRSDTHPRRHRPVVVPPDPRPVQLPRKVSHP